MDTAPIESMFLANRPTPQNELSARLEALLSGPNPVNTDDTKRQAQRLNARIHALHIPSDPRKRARAVQTEATVRAYIAYLGCPDAEPRQVNYHVDDPEWYEDDDMIDISGGALGVVRSVSPHHARARRA
ncbi:hypothetical protein PG988_003458 [Apiospora saccharicola]